MASLVVSVWHSYIYRVIHKSLRDFRTRLRNNQDRHGRKEQSVGRESLQVFFVLGALAYFQMPPLGGSRDEKWRSQWIRKRSVSWNLPKLSHLWLQRRFRIMYHTEPPTDKTIREWYMNSSRVAACSFRSAQAAALLEFMYHSRIVLSVGGSVWLCGTWSETSVAQSQLTQFWQIPRHRTLSYSLWTPFFFTTTPWRWNLEVRQGL